MYKKMFGQHKKSRSCALAAKGLTESQGTHTTTHFADAVDLVLLCYFYKTTALT